MAQGDSGLSLCEAFSLPPRAIILNNQQNAVRLRLSRFLSVAPAYKSKLLTHLLHTKNASLLAMHFADYQVIRLGFGRITGNPEKSCGLLAASIAYKVLKYNDINYI